MNPAELLLKIGQLELNLSEALEDKFKLQRDLAAANEDADRLARDLENSLMMPPMTAEYIIRGHLFAHKARKEGIPYER